MSSRQTSGGGAVGYQPATTSAWNFAVPTDEEPLDQVYGQALSKSSTTSSRPRQPLSSHVNGSSRPKTRHNSRPTQTVNSQDIAAGSLKPPPRPQAQGDSSDGGSGVDSLLDLYQPSKESLRGGSRERQRVKRKGSQGAVSSLQGQTQEDPDKWIHRDKLQQIEIREMMEEGRRLDYPTRPSSQSGTQTSQAQSVADGNEDLGEEMLDSRHDSKRQRLGSPVLSSTGAQEETRLDEDSQAQHSSPHARRPSTSRIPVTKSSPAADDPPSSIRYDKTRRVRSGSDSSQNVLDTSGPAPMTSNKSKPFDTPPQSSPASPKSSSSKARSASKPLSATRGRNVSRGGRAPSGQSRPRTATSPGNGTSSRPGTSGGRPPTARPEGEPPWIDQMYKPDPMLPPDQQMLPTHARRLHEERQMAPAAEASPARYNDLTLLEDEDASQDLQRGGMRGEGPDSRNNYNDRMQDPQNPSPKKSPSPRLGPRKRESLNSQKRRSWDSQAQKGPSLAASQESEQWPLRSLSFNKYAAQPAAPTRPKSETGSSSSNRPHHQSGEPAGYSLMPPVQSPKEMEQRMSARSPVPQQAPQTVPPINTEPTRVPEEPEEANEKSKKGCAGCCIVM